MSRHGNALGFCLAAEEIGLQDKKLKRAAQSKYLIKYNKRHQHLKAYDPLLFVF